MNDLLTVEDVAARLGISVRTLRQEIARHKPPVIAAGRRKLFDAEAYAFLIEALKCRSSSPAAPARRSGGSRGRSAASEYERALELATQGLPTSDSLKKNARPAKPVSTAKKSTGRQNSAVPSRP